MKVTVDNSMFKRIFEEYGRDTQFTDDALDAMFDYYMEYEESAGEEIEFDCVACCCEWTEYDADELAAEFNRLLDEDEEYDTPEDRLEAIIEAVNDETTLIKVNNGCFLVMAY